MGDDRHPLEPRALRLLREIHRADEEAGGLLEAECAGDEVEILQELLDRELIEYRGEYGEAPDGEEDERVPGGGVYRITARGVEVLADTP